MFWRSSWGLFYAPWVKGGDINKELPESSLRYFFYLYPLPETIEISLVSFTFFLLGLFTNLDSTSTSGRLSQRCFYIEYRMGLID